MIFGPPPVLRIVGGAAEITRYHVGDLLVCSGFPAGDNNMPGLRVLSVAVNGADLDITLDDGGVPVVAEAAAGARDIKLVCQSVFNYAAAANAASLGGYTDWRVPNTFAFISLVDLEKLNPTPDVVAFPGWPAAAYWCATAVGAASAERLTPLAGLVAIGIARAGTNLAVLVRG